MKNCFLFIIHLLLSADAVSTPSLHPFVKSPPGVQCTLISTGSCLLKGEPRKKPVFNNFQPHSAFEQLVKFKLKRRGGNSILNQEERNCRRFKGCGNHVVRLPRHNHLPSSSILKVSFVLPVGIWDCRFAFIRSDIFIERQG